MMDDIHRSIHRVEEEEEEEEEYSSFPKKGETDRQKENYLPKSRLKAD
jgi:hypothetical protein